jgi:hypothetical protein
VFVEIYLRIAENVHGADLGRGIVRGLLATVAERIVGMVSAPASIGIDRDRAQADQYRLWLTVVLQGRVGEQVEDACLVAPCLDKIDLRQTAGGIRSDAGQAVEYVLEWQRRGPLSTQDREDGIEKFIRRLVGRRSAGRTDEARHKGERESDGRTHRVHFDGALTKKVAHPPLSR